MNTQEKHTPLAALRHHVSGAIERGEAEAIVEQRQALSFDGCGINGPDAYRKRIATFTDRNTAKEWGPLLAAAPELLAALEDLVDSASYVLHHSQPSLSAARRAIAKARGQQH